MKTFNELPIQDKIQSVKDIFVSMLEMLSADISKLNYFMPTPEPPVLIENIPAADILVQDKDASINEEQLAFFNEKQLAAQKEIDAKNNALKEIFKEKQEAIDKVKTFIASLKKEDGCSCGMCIKYDSINYMVPPELEPLVDVAREKAKVKNY